MSKKVRGIGRGLFLLLESEGSPKLGSMDFETASEHLADCAREFYRRGWVLGTSGNFSAVLSSDPLKVCITASGNDKKSLARKHFLAVNENAEIISGDGRPSAETLLHLCIYKQRPDARAVMHTHSVWGTILSDIYFLDGSITIEGYEMLKGLSGIDTHEHIERIPVIDNSQDYIALSHVFENTLRENPQAHGIYLRRHGLYTWGKSTEETNRHVEIFEFLFEVLGRSRERAADNVKA